MPGAFDHSPAENAGQSDSNTTVSMSTREQDSSEASISAGQKMLSAVSGSLLTSLLVTPLDVVRVRLQSQPKSSSIPRSSHSLAALFTSQSPNLGVTACCREVFWMSNTSPVCLAAGAPATTPLGTLAASSTSPAVQCAIDESRQKTFTSTVDGLRKIARHEGISSLWRGLSPTLVMAIPANVIYFTGYDSLRSNHRSPIRNYIPDTYAPLVAGSIARVAAAAAISPIEMFRTRMQAAPSGASGVTVFKDTLIGLRKLAHTQGFTSLWRGLTLTMWRDVPFSGIYWWGYEAMRDNLVSMRNGPRDQLRHVRSSQDHTATFVDSFVAGATSGAIASIITTPFDVGKTRQQVVESDGSRARSNLKTGYTMPEERSMPRFLYHIWRVEGVPGLFRGWAARCLKVAPACAIMISSYEVGKKMARRMNEKNAGQS